MKKLCLLLSVFLLLALCASLGSCNDAPATYTITFAAQGTSQMTALTVKDGETVTLTPCEYVKDGYTFSGWATQENGAVVYKDKASVTVSKDMTLYPVFTENAAPTYKVSFLADGCEGTMDFVTVTAGESLTLPACAFTKTGFSFRGWATSDGGDVAYEDAASFVPSSDLTLYAVFEKDDFTFVLNVAENGYLVASVLTDQTALTIPETYNGKPVVGIVPGAFNGLSVKSFAVKGKNLYVKENVLYSGDKKTLLAYPAGAEATSFTLPREAATVSPYAFAGCSLTSVDLNKASSVGEYAFLNAASLNAVSAEYLYRVDLGAFDGTPVSTLVTAKTGTVQYLNYSASGSVLLKVDAGTEGTLTIKNGCTAIAGGAAPGCTGLP
ncbi:MAG: InlB B-repeat-containing protein, partial [Clostridia bacterium]|nr:InlB B-repeat-containing protein [Clostridia bacterium]